MLTDQSTRRGGHVKPPPGKLRPGFSAIPHDLRLDPRLKPRDLQLVASLLGFARAKASCYPSNGRLASEMRCGPRTVQLCLKRLVEAGWVRIDLGADNPTGRLITLAWREADCAPPCPSASPRIASPIAPERFAEKGREKERSGVGLAKEGPTSPSGQTEGASRAELFALAEGVDPFLQRWARKLLASHHPAQPEPTLAELHQWADDPSNPALQSLARKRLASIEPTLAVGTGDDVGSADGIRVVDAIAGASKGVGSADTLRPRSSGGANVMPPCPAANRVERHPPRGLPEGIRQMSPPSSLMSPPLVNPEGGLLGRYPRRDSIRRATSSLGCAQSAPHRVGPRSVGTLGDALSRLIGRMTT